ncbi:hypothetical protein F5148DRAFT_1235681 [Russula earlei]|uniref:Uncharacterized protein n=1 Tax=Russula earlei TaxID=71964 RepID=A0ACC0TX95_9AGAM|nr:hypothetical protein F5148DRAFT_1235681 [Russula earlei]
MSSVLKIPLILVAAVGAWYSLTPPQPPPRAQERVKSGGVERSFGSVVRVHALVWKVCTADRCPRSVPTYVQCSVLASLLAELVACVSAPGTMPIVFVLGCLMTAASGALRLACYRTLGSLFTYTGVVLGVVGTLVVHFGPGSWWARAGWLGTLSGKAYAMCWCAMEIYVLASILVRASTEDVLLKKQFGAEWDAWAARVPYRVIPGVF